MIYVIDSTILPENEPKKIEIIEHSELKIEMKIDPELAQTMRNLEVSVFNPR